LILFSSHFEKVGVFPVHPPRRQQDKLHQEFYNVPTKVPNNPKVSSGGKVSTRGDGKTPFQNSEIVEFLRKKSRSKKPSKMLAFLLEFGSW